jgi:hypothetical protein
MCVCVRARARACVCLFYLTKYDVSLYFQAKLVRKAHHASKVCKSNQHILLRMRFVHSEIAVSYSHIRS